MEPLSIIILLALAASAASVVIFWGKIVGWAHDALFPWVSTNIPRLLPFLKKAFVVLDKAVVAVRRAAALAWVKVRKFLLKHLQKFFRRDGAWYRIVESWLVTEDNEKVTKVTTEEQVDWDHLPDDIREEMMRRRSYEVDVTATMDQNTMAM